MRNFLLLCALAAAIAPQAQNRAPKQIFLAPFETLLMARQSKVFFFEPQTDRWFQFADLDKARIRSITRLAVSPDAKWIAIVSYLAVK